MTSALKKYFSRFRHVYMVLGGLAVVLLHLLTDPESPIIRNMPFGASVVVHLAVMAKVVWFVALLHVSRRALFDYLNLYEYFEIAKQSPEGAARVVMAMGLVMVALAIVIMAAVMT